MSTIDFILISSGRLGNALFRYFAYLQLASSVDRPTLCSWRYLHDKPDVPTIVDETPLPFTFLPEYTHIVLYGHFQQDWVISNDLKEKCRPDDTVVTDRGVRVPIDVFLQDTLDTVDEVIIHIRLDDFYGQVDYISLDAMISFLARFRHQYPASRVICEEPRNANDVEYLTKCLQVLGPKHKYTPSSWEEDFERIRRARVVVCSMSTFAWAAVALSDVVEEVWMPEYNFPEHPFRTLRYPSKRATTYTYPMTPETHVFVIPNWCKSKDYIPVVWPKMSENNDMKWKDMRVVDNDKQADYYVLLNADNGGQDYYDPKRTIIVQMEGGIHENRYWNWGEFSNPDPNKFYKVLTCANYRSAVEWWITSSYRDLLSKPIGKPEAFRYVLASVMSHNYFSDGHRQRVQFLQYIEQYMPMESLHIWGGGWKCGLPELKGHQIDRGILPYRYWFHAERCAESGYFCGGKLITGIVSECLVFYWGCPDVERWIDPEAFIRLDFTNFEWSYQRIREALNGNEWERRLPAIQAMKKKILNEYQMFPMIYEAIKGKDFI